MSINQIIKNHQYDLEGVITAKYYTLDFNLNLSKVVIPFSKMCKSSKPADIYSGTEKIPYNERDPEFKLILRQEFSGILK